MGMACERIPLRYGVRSDHLLCSVLFISSCNGTLDIIGILILIFYGEMSKFVKVCACKVLRNWFTQKAKWSLVGHFPVLPLRGSIKTGSCSTGTRTQSYNKRLSHYLLSSKSNNIELLCVRDKIRTPLQF